MSDYLGHVVARTLAPVNGVRPQLPSLFEPPSVNPGLRPRAGVDFESSGEVSSRPAAPRPIAVEQADSDRPRLQAATHHGHDLDSIAPTRTNPLPARPTEVSGERAGQRVESKLTPAAIPQPKVPAPPAPRVSPLDEQHQETSRPLPPHRGAVSKQSHDQAEAVGSVSHQPPQSIFPRPAFEVAPPRATAVPGITPAVRAPTAQGTPQPPAPAGAAPRVTIQPSAIRPGPQTPRPRQTVPISAPKESHTINVTIGRIEVRAMPAPGQPARRAAPRVPGIKLEEHLRRRSAGGQA